jgi:alpha-glucosidase
LGEPALYVKANTPIPLGPETSHTGERPSDPLTFLIYPAANAGDGEFVLYEDAGDGYGYEDGEYARRTVSCEESGDRVTVRVGERQGSFAPEREELRLELRGFTSAPESVEVDGEPVESGYEEDTVLVPLAETGGALTVEVVR